MLGIGSICLLAAEVWIFFKGSIWMVFAIAACLLCYAPLYRKVKTRNIPNAQRVYDELCEAGAILKVPNSLKGKWEQTCNLRGYKRGLSEWDTVMTDYFVVIRDILSLKLTEAQSDSRLSKKNREGINAIIQGWFGEVADDIQARRRETKHQAALARKNDSQAFNAGIQSLLEITPPNHGYTPSHRPTDETGE